MELVEIAAGSLQLRPWNAADLDPVRAALADPEIQRWSPPMPGACTGPDDAERWLANRAKQWAENKHYSFAVMDAVSGEVLGNVSAQSVDRDFGNGDVGYWVLEHARGRGVATQSVQVLTRWMFGALELSRVNLFHAVDNLASCGVAKRSGFLLEGTLRQSAPTKAGGRNDEHLHARIASDPDPAF